VGLKLNGTHQIVACVDNVNLLGYNTEITQIKPENVTDASKEAGLEVNVEKTVSSPECRSKSGHENSKLII
jgi:hypothetical protein